MSSSGRASVRGSLALAVLLVAADQFSKFWIQSHWALGESRPFLPFLRLTYHLNSGAAFGMAQGASLALTTFGLLFIAVWGVWLFRSIRRRSLGRLGVCGAMLIWAGAIGNFIDRVRLGRVVDFFDVGFWPIFNVADSCITVGATLYVVYVLLQMKKERA